MNNTNKIRGETIAVGGWGSGDSRISFRLSILRAFPCICHHSPLRPILYVTPMPA